MWTQSRQDGKGSTLTQVEADLAHINRVSMLGELAASVAHELKQPIAVAARHAEACLRWLRRDHADVDKASEAATGVLEDASRAHEIIDRLRSLYKKSPPQRELVDVNETIREMVAVLLGEAPEGTGFGFSGPADETRISPPRIRCWRSGTWSTHRKRPSEREAICKSAACRYASQVFRVSSFNSAPRDTAGATREPAQMSVTRNRRNV